MKRRRLLIVAAGVLAAAVAAVVLWQGEIDVVADIHAHGAALAQVPISTTTTGERKAG